MERNLYSMTKTPLQTDAIFDLAALFENGCNIRGFLLSFCERFAFANIEVSVTPPSSLVAVLLRIACKPAGLMK